MTSQAKNYIPWLFQLVWTMMYLTHWPLWYAGQLFYFRINKGMSDSWQDNFTRQIQLKAYHIFTNIPQCHLTCFIRGVTYNDPRPFLMTLHTKGNIASNDVSNYCGLTHCPLEDLNEVIFMIYLVIDAWDISGEIAEMNTCITRTYWW